MAKKIALFSCLFFICASSWAIDKNLEKMNDALARGYLAVSRNKPDEALGYFKAAATYAGKAASWRGLIDAADAFSVLGKTQDCLYFLKNAVDISDSKNDWRGLVACGYAYLALPEEANVKNSANDAFIQAYKIAIKNDDWRGTIEGIKGLIESGEKEASKTYLADVKDLVEKLKSSEGYKELSYIYKKLGDNELFSECFGLSDKYQKTDIKTVSPPSGWQPAGPTIAGPARVSAEAQQAMRYYADEDITRKTQWMIEQGQKEKQRQNYFYQYRTYYTYPYYYSYYGYWSTLTPAELTSWAAFYLANYDAEDGTYIYVGW